ncbi:dihydrolipoamide acetyltransferase family protein [Mariniluteicoccus flavus]
MKTFNLTDPGEGLTEAEIITWRVAEGDTVKVNDIVVEVETSKSLVELPIPWAGKVVKIMAAEGDTVDVGAPIITIDDGTGVDEKGRPAGDAGGAEPASRSDAGTLAERAPASRSDDMVPAGTLAERAPASRSDDMVPAAPAGGESEGEKAKRTPNLVGYGPSEGSTTRRARKSPTGKDLSAAKTHHQVADVFATSQPVGRRADVREALPAEPVEASGEALPSPGHAPEPEVGVKPGKVLAKPPVRKLAKDLGIDLSQVPATGPNGVVTRDDVEAYRSQGASADSAPPAGSAAKAPARVVAGLEDRRVPIKGVRRMTAQAMVDSAFTAPHVTEWTTIDATATMELLETLKARREFKDVRLSPTVLVAKACLVAMGRNPELNSAWDEAAQEIVYRGSVNLGIAAATPRGLVVPNIKGAEQLSLLDLANALTELVTVAKSGRTQPADMAGGTFTITNIGVFGIDAGTPILNPGEAGILAMGAIERRPWVVGTGADERIEPRWVTTLALSFDHRLVDGEQGSKFLADVAQVLSNPGLALLF